jgi:hypothetical protein
MKKTLSIKDISLKLIICKFSMTKKSRSINIIVWFAAKLFKIIFSKIIYYKNFPLLKTNKLS